MHEGGFPLVDNEVNEEANGGTEDIQALRQALAEEKDKAENYLANWQRTQADFANYKQRAEKDREDSIEFANCALIFNLLPVIDDLERAVGAVPDELDGSSWTEGIKLIYNKLKSTLEAQGLTEIQAEGEPFDPRLHEAVMQKRGKEGVVVGETQKGYKFKDRVIRPSLVVVGTGEEIARREQKSRDTEGGAENGKSNRH